MEDVASKRKLWLVLVAPFIALMLFPSIKTYLDQRITFPEWMQPNQKARRSSCRVQLQQIHLAMSMYAKDHNDEWPRVQNNGLSLGWADGIQPYLHNVLVCPSEATANIGIAASQRGFTDYWMNRNLSKRKISSLQHPSIVLLFGDGNDGIDNSDATYNLNAFPVRWLNSRKSPMFRHLNGANYVFADGHIRWLKPDEMPYFGGRTDSFALN